MINCCIEKSNLFENFIYVLKLTNKKALDIPTLFSLVPVVGLEPTRPGGQQILSLSRLPVPTHRRKLLTNILYNNLCPV